MHKVNEAVTIGKIVEPILRIAGINTEDFNRIEEEYEIKTTRGSIIVDRMLKNISGKAICAVQVKKIGDTYSLKSDIHKTIPIITDIGVTYSIYTDGIEWRIFRANKHLCTINLLAQNTEKKKIYLVNLIKRLLKEKNELIS